MTDIALGTTARLLAQAISDGEVLVDGSDAILIRRGKEGLRRKLSGVLRKETPAPHNFTVVYRKFPVRQDCVGDLLTLCKRAGLPAPAATVVELRSRCE